MPLSDHEPAVAGSGARRGWRGALQSGQRKLKGDYGRLLSGTAIGQALVVLTTPLVTRLYAPADVGIFMVLATFVGVTSYTASWRLELALVSERDEMRARSLLALCLALTLPMACLVGLACWLGARTGFRGLDAVPAAAPLLAAALVAVTGTFSALRYWSVRNGSFAPIARALTTQGLARATAPVALAAWHTDWLVLCIGEILGRLAGIRALSRGLGRLLRGAFSLSSWRTLLRRHWKFPVLLMPSALLDALAQNAAIPAVALSFGSAAAGHYALALRVGGTAVTHLTASAGDVLHARIAVLDAAERRHYVWRQARRLALLGVALFAPAAALAPWLAGPVLGAAWRDVGWMFALSTPAFFAMLVVGPLSRMLLVTNRVELKLLADAACLALPLAAFFAAGRLGLGAALAALIGGTLVAYAIYLAVIIVAARGRIAPPGILDAE